MYASSAPQRISTPRSRRASLACSSTSRRTPPLNGSYKTLRRWYQSGLRILQPAYGSGSNQTLAERLAGGSDETIGLTKLGREVVREAIRLGIIVDLSHCNEATILETCKLALQSGVPVTANHTAAREIRWPDGRYRALHARNISDRALRAIKSTGGVVGVMAYPPYLYGPAQVLGERVRAPARAITIDDYVAHVDYIAKLIGPAHVGFATDGYLDGSHVRGRKADGILDSPGRWKAAATKLHKLGYGEAELASMIGGNFLRVYRRVLE